MTAARGVRNKNPGNIEAGAFTQRQPGFTGPEPEGRFATFETMGHGIAALIALLRVYRKQHNLTTVRGIINRWAPPTENVTSAYVTAVCDGWVAPDEELPDEPNTYLFLAQRIARHENGASQAAQITPADWEAGMALAGLSASIPPATPVPTPVPEKKMPAPFIGLALEALLSSVPSLIRHFGKGTRSEENAKLAEVIVPIAKEAVGAANEQALVERLSDPASVAAIDQAMRAKWLDIVESGGGGIEGARAFNLAAANVPLGRQPAFVISCILLLFPLMMVVDVFFVHPGNFTSELRTQVVTGILLVISIVGAYWLGSSMSSRTKDELISKR